MSIHSYSRCWLHLIWATLDRQCIITPSAAIRISSYLQEYAETNDIFMKINFVNAEHVHALIDLPTKYSIEECMKLLKGASSHWINQNRIIADKFYWGRGYGVFSVSHSHIDRVIKYIFTQKDHHQKKTFLDEYKKFISVYGLKWHEDES